MDNPCVEVYEDFAIIRGYDNMVASYEADIQALWPERHERSGRTRSYIRLYVEIIRRMRNEA